MIVLRLKQNMNNSIVLRLKYEQ